MANLVKNATVWQNPNRQGYYTNIGNCFIVDNSGNFLVDNSKNFLVTNPNSVSPANATVWTPTLAS